MGRVKKEGFQVEINFPEVACGDSLSELGRLRKSEIKYHELYQNLVDGLAVINLEGKIIEFNPAFQNLIGYATEEIYSLTYMDISPAKWHAAEEKILKEQVMKRRYSDIYEKEYRKKDGTIVPVELRTYLIRDEAGTPTGYWAIIRDITERKRSEELLRIKDRAIESSINAFAMADLEGNLIYSNPRFLYLWGYENREAVLGRSLVEFWEVKEPAFEIVEKLRSRGGWIGELVSKRKDGSRFDTQISASMILDNAGKPICMMASGVDITDRKKIAKELQESEAKYRLLVDNSYDLICALNKEGVFTYASPSWQRILGYDASYVIGKTIHTFVHPDDAAIFEDHFHEIIQPKKRKRVPEHRVKHADGTWRWLAASRTPVFDSDGTFISLVCISRDVTELKQASEALKESQQQLLDIINFLPDATFVIDTDGKVVAWNKAMEEMTGIKAAAMLDKGNYEYALPFYGERRPILIDLVLEPQAATETKYANLKRGDLVLEAEINAPSLGEDIYLYGRVRVLRDSKGNIVGAIESIRDITDHRLAQEKYKALFENAVMGIFQTSLEGHIISANPELARILGYGSPEELMSAVTADRLYVQPNQRSELMRLFQEKGTLQEQEVQLYRKDGSTTWVVVSCRAVLDKSGKPLHCDGYMIDTSDRKLLEKQLRQAQKMEAIGTLAGGIAHDFNNILSAVIGYAEMALRNPEVSGKLRHHIEQIYKAGNRAGDLVEQILAFSRQSDENRYPLRISPIVKEALKLLRASIPSTIEIHQNIQSEPDSVLANPSNIHRILMNLCTNAAQAMSGRKGILEIGLAPVDIKPNDVLIHQGLTPGMHIKLSVSDTGQGISHEIIDKIFDPFFTTKKPGEGTGMGLSVVHGIVKSYGGTITVQSEVSKGTRFEVYLPLLIEEEKKQPKEAAPIVGGVECILFVDDEESLVELGEGMLTGLGYKVVGRTSSLEALELFRAHPDWFDLVITDVTMPNMTGLELARELMLIRPDIQVILCTGFSELVTSESVKSLGLREVIMKPILLEQIDASIRRLIDQKE
jgi:PAS domain S-box-containing protein